jgi:hypothetical protein
VAALRAAGVRTGRSRGRIERVHADRGFGGGIRFDERDARAMRFERSDFATQGGTAQRWRIRAARRQHDHRARCPDEVGVFEGAHTAVDIAPILDGRGRPYHRYRAARGNRVDETRAGRRVEQAQLAGLGVECCRRKVFRGPRVRWQASGDDRAPFGFADDFAVEGHARDAPHALVRVGELRDVLRCPIQRTQGRERR